MKDCKSCTLYAVAWLAMAVLLGASLYKQNRPTKPAVGAPAVIAAEAPSFVEPQHFGTIQDPVLAKSDAVPDEACDKVDGTFFFYVNEGDVKGFGTSTKSCEAALDDAVRGARAGATQPEIRNVI